MSAEREVLPDRAALRLESLNTPVIADASQVSLAFARQLMTALGPIVHPSAGLTKKCCTFANSQIAVFATGYPPHRLVTILRGTLDKLPAYG
ncbi:hypothetical protein [Paraburkholderia susongensis]|uniref:Uncharacterized protein n=1 Tax=Paraburkholderia susongensis TaxID=1515439 RepID=A0A1X7M5U9_9BURK|nr:hypothetical protein [Paraburkholderia susongensis]SMG61097.1 hypothetical protein SAMN06265784_11959 [Paraburkholderia susongensis]